MPKTFPSVLSGQYSSDWIVRLAIHLSQSKDTKTLSHWIVDTIISPYNYMLVCEEHLRLTDSTQNLATPGSLHCCYLDFSIYLLQDLQC